MTCTCGYAYAVLEILLNSNKIQVHKIQDMIKLHVTMDLHKKSAATMDTFRFCVDLRKTEIFPDVNLDLFERMF